MKETMLRLHKLLFLVLVSCTASLSGMEQTIPDFARQTHLLPGAPIRQTGIGETVVRDAFCGGFIKSSLIAVSIMVALLANHQEGPCNLYRAEGIVTLSCAWQITVGFFCIACAIALKGLGYLGEVANNHPTGRAVVWRDRCRLLYGIATAYAILNSDYLFEKIM